MALTLYEQDGCPHCEKVTDRLDELDIDYESVRVSERHSERDVVKQLSGQRQVPVIVDDERGVTMPESDRIIEYLNATHDQSRDSE